MFFANAFQKKKKKHKHSYVMLMATRVFFFIFLFFSICMRYTHNFFFTLACSNDAYGSDCEYTCGHCFNNASCERNNGTCSNGCEKGHTGSDCKQRKCFKIFYKCMKKKHTIEFSFIKSTLEMFSLTGVRYLTLVW